MNLGALKNGYFNENERHKYVVALVKIMKDRKIILLFELLRRL